METLNKKLQAITDEAILIIKNHVDSSNEFEEPSTKFWTEEFAFDEDAQELTDKFLSEVPEIVHYFEFEGNLTLYPLSIEADEHPTDIQVVLIDEQGNLHKVELFEMDAHNLTVLADWLNK